MRYEGLTPAQAADVARSAADLVQSIRRTAPRVFEKEIANEFRADSSLEVQREAISDPPVRRQADFLVMTDSRRIVVEGVFIRRETAQKSAWSVIRDKASYQQAFGADRVLVIIPDGVEFPARALDELAALAPATRVLKLRELRLLTRARNGLADA
jgi:hypothetical protein